MNLPSEVKSALEQSHDAPVELIDTETSARYFVVRADMYERLMAKLDFSEPTAEEQKALIQAWGKRAGWEEPDAAVFDDLTPL
jgi:hypothetical protein